MRIFVTKPQLKPEVTGYGSADKDMLFRGLCWTFLQILGHSAYDPKMPDHTNLLIKGVMSRKQWKISAEIFFDLIFSCFQSLIECKKVGVHIKHKMRIFVTKPQLKPEVTGYGAADKDM